MRYRSCPADDGEVRSRLRLRLGLRELAQRRRRFGYRWLHIPPTCVGIGPTKTLAKFANHIAKIISEPRSSPNSEACAAARTRRSAPPGWSGFRWEKGGHRARLAGAARRHGRRHGGGSARPRSPSGAGLAAGGRRAHHLRTARPRLPACRSRSCRPGARAARSPAAFPAESPNGRCLNRLWPRTRRGSGRSCDATGSRSWPSRSSPTPASTTGATRCARSRRWCTCRRRRTTAAT